MHAPFLSGRPPDSAQRVRGVEAERDVGGVEPAELHPAEAPGEGPRHPEPAPQHHEHPRSAGRQLLGKVRN